jgi:hypothetical protein
MFSEPRARCVASTRADERCWNTAYKDNPFPYPRLCWVHVAQFLVDTERARARVRQQAGRAA